MSIAPGPSHRQLRHLVAERLRAAILSGGLKAGEWLRQERLAQEYGVSQMPVREALKELAAEGLVEHVPYRGVRVVAFAPHDVEDLYAHRAFLEGRAAAAAAATITAGELAELKRLYAAMLDRMAPEQIAEYRALNRQFHQLIVHASRRTYLVRSLAQIWVAFPSMLWSNISSTAAAPLPDRDARDPAEHAAIVEALERRDAAAAEHAARVHIEGAGGTLARALAQQPSENAS
ncbi:MAG: GntR family transcriptional regulator [Roseiflexaceae bacterium]|nr:GntR family transcriptional regulator [Roseiflexaceae bacterium]